MISNPTPLYGLGLRFVIADILRRANRPLKVSELVDIIHRQGFAFAGRPSKAVSDSLRTEVRKGRARRLSRGVYAFGVTSRSTLRRINVMAQTCRAYVVALTRPQFAPWTTHYWIWRI